MTQPHPNHPDTLAPIPVALFLPPGHLRATSAPDDAGLSPYIAGLLIVTYTRTGDRIINRAESAALACVAVALHRHVTTGTDRVDGQPDRPAMLIYAQIPRPGQLDADLHGLTEWMREQRLTLARGGFLVTAVSADSPDSNYIDRATTVITAARGAGLIYHQHLVAVHEPVPETRPPDDARTAGARSAAPAGRLYTRCHGDLFVFASIAGGHHG